MEDYLEALERLGKLLESGVLTKEEFEQEKSRLLRGAQPPQYTAAGTPRSKFWRYGIAAALAVVIVGGAIGFTVYQTISEKGYNKKEGAGTVAQANARDTQLHRISVTFADPSTCEPGPTLAELLARLKEAGSADAGSSLRLVHLAGDPNPVEVQSILQDAGSQQVRLSRLPVSTRWQGLKLTELRTTDWEEGTGFQLYFEVSPEILLKNLNEAGFHIEAVDKPLATGRDFIAVEKGVNGAVLTCLRSHRAAVPEALTETKGES